MLMKTLMDEMATSSNTVNTAYKKELQKKIIERQQAKQRSSEKKPENKTSNTNPKVLRFSEL